MIYVYHIQYDINMIYIYIRNLTHLSKIISKVVCPDIAGIL